MKKPKSNTKSVKTSAIKPAEEPRWKELKKLEDDTHINPTVFQLAQIAAQIFCREDFKPEKDEIKNIAEMARKLWDACASKLENNLQEQRWRFAFAMAHPKEEEPEPEPQDYPEWVEVYNKGHFPMQFEESLKVIIGRNIRQPDRHKAIRDFLRAVYVGNVKNKTDLESVVTEIIKLCKQQGISSDQFQAVAILYPYWKAIRAKTKAQQAASKRWGKKKPKISLAESDFSKMAFSSHPSVFSIPARVV